jgi:heme O synthase-like polyprenyltransferase
MLAFILKFLDTAVQISGVIAVTLMIVTGLMMVFSQGNQNMVEKAKQMFTYEIIGIVIIFVSYVAVSFIQSIFTT